MKPSDIKAFLLANNIGTDSNIVYNFSNTLDNLIVIWRYGGIPNDMLNIVSFQISVKNTDMQEAETLIELIQKTLVPKEQLNKKLNINNKYVCIRKNQPYFYNEIDEQKRHVFILNITITESEV